MQGAEGRADEIAVGWVALEVEQAEFELLEQLARLLPEGFCRVGEAHEPVPFLTTATCCSCLKGLTIQPVAPAALASALRLSSDSEVRKMIGTPLLAGCWRNFLMNSMPFITGILRSVRMASTGCAMARS